MLVAVSDPNPTPAPSISPDPSEAPASPGPIDRRRALRLLGLGGIAALAACSTSSPSSSSEAAVPSTGPSTTQVPSIGPSTTLAPSTTVGGAAATTSTTAAPVATTAAVDPAASTPGETGGPFPADGTNGNGAGATADVLSDRRSVRRDIRGDLDGSNVQDGVPTRLSVRVVQKGNGAPLAGAAVYVWHCNRLGKYSAYNSSMNGGDFSARSFLRGVQIADADGRVTFDTVLPGRYQGRAFHIHFEVFRDGTYGSKLLTSQMAVDDKVIDTLYGGATGYAEALRADTDNARDNVFSDGVNRQLLEVRGDVTGGLAMAFTAVV
jgi:protocatechuate 3,4-dioxygenase beta subunit